MLSSTGANASASRWAMPELGSSSSSTDGLMRERARDVDDAARAGRQLADELVGEAPEVHQFDQVVDLGRRRLRSAIRTAGEMSAAANGSRTSR